MPVFEICGVVCLRVQKFFGLLGIWKNNFGNYSGNKGLIGSFFFQTGTY